MTDTLHLTRADVEAVATYIWQHCRASPNGRGYKVWEKMQEFLEGEIEKEEPETPLFPVPTIEEMCGLIPDFTEGLSLKEYMDRLSNE